jgi:hypothetical protein
MAAMLVARTRSGVTSLSPAGDQTVTEQFRDGPLALRRLQ